MAFDKPQIKEIYRRRAGLYDFTANLYYLVGFREHAYRRMAVAELRVKPGDVVLEIGCGTGLNLPFLRKAVGDNGRVIGIDLTDRMLDEARQRVHRNAWQNVDLIETDAARFNFPARLDGVISTFALTLVPEYEQVIRNAVSALVPGGRLVILDLKQPERFPLWLTKLAVLITKPFGVTLDLANRKPWKAMADCLEDVRVADLYLGFAYLARGVKPTTSAAKRSGTTV